MEFNIQRNILLAGIQKTLGIIEKKSAMPILNNVLLRVEDGELIIIATDREITLVAHYAADVMSHGEVTVSAKKLYEMIREIPDGLVHIKKSDTQLLTVSCEKVIYKINGMAADEFPTIADDGDVPLFSVEGAVLAELIAKTFFAISLDETRRNLTGALLEVENSGEKNILRMVATDGHRMALSEVMAEGGNFLKLDKGVIVPRKGLAEIRKLVEESRGAVFVGIQGSMCVVRIPDVVLKINLIDAEFPDYRRVLPKEKGIAIKLDREAIFHSLKRVSVVSSEGYGGVVLSVKDNLLVLKSNDYNVGEALDEIAVSYGGDEIVIGYNVGYLLNAIDVITEKEVVLEMGKDSKPSIVKGEGNNHYLCVIMPLNL